MSDSVDLKFVLARLDNLQKEMGMLRLRDEQREASHQTMTLTLSRQMVEMTMVIERRLVALDERIDRIETRIDRIDETLSHFDERFDRIEVLLHRAEIARGGDHV